MRIMLVNHGYPVRYNAGSEIYTQNIARGLTKTGNTVHVFSRVENPFLDPFKLIEEKDEFEGISLPITLVNVMNLHNRYQTDLVDLQFEKVLKDFNPDIAHFNHLNHLSLGLVDKVASLGIPIVFTLHDFWLSCPRGQFIQNNYGFGDPWVLCDGQEDRKCAIHCCMRFATGEADSVERDVTYWTEWVKRRREHISKIVEEVNLFLAPSFYLMERMKSDLQLPDHKIMYLDYGFDIKRLYGRERSSDEIFTFGYIGTHIVTKGIHLLIQAFSKLTLPAKLIIWGRSRAETTPHLKKLADKLPPPLQIEWREEYLNEHIVSEVFNNVDAIVVPSIWMENSPLVIHEAQQARVPVITADAGGMADYVRHMENGLTFRHRDMGSLSEQLQFAVENPALMKKLGKRGYIYSDGDVVSIDDHIKELTKIYHKLTGGKKS